MKKEIAIVKYDVQKIVSIEIAAMVDTIDGIVGMVAELLDNFKITSNKFL